MSRSHFLLMIALLSIAAIGCGHSRPKKPDPTKGAVIGTVLCNDTAKPARFATVTLVAVPHDGNVSDTPAAIEEGTTDLNGQFDLEAVAPGRYYAFATLPGYIDPEMSLDFDHLKTLESDNDRLLETIKQWKGHLVEVTVHAQRSSSIRLSIERAAEIQGAVTYDDGSPAIGMHFRAYRKDSKGEWSCVGLRLLGDWSLKAESDSHGRYTIEGMPAGEYRICALLPVYAEDETASVCLGNVLRAKFASSVQVGAGEIVTGQDIVIPLSGLYTLSGNVSVLSDGHPPSRATLHLLYADDHKELRTTSSDTDGDYTFSFVPPGNYILRVTEASDSRETDSGSGGSTKIQLVPYADKEMPLLVQGDTTGITVQLVPAHSAAAQPQ